MTWLRGGRWTAGNRPEPSRAHGRGRSSPSPEPCSLQRSTRRRRSPSRRFTSWRTPTPFPILAIPPGRVWWARGRERGGPTRSHPEPGRDPRQRRRVLWSWLHGRRGRCGPSRRTSRACQAITHRRGVEQWQLVGLITQRSGVRIPPPPPSEKIWHRVRSLFCILHQKEEEPDV